MAKTCENCKYSRKFNRMIYHDGSYAGDEECMTCVNEKSMRWYRQVNNLITCNEWETTENEKS